MRILQSILLGLFSSALFPVNIAWSEPLVAILDPEAKQLEEVYKDEVPVSGRVIAGLSLAGVSHDGDLAILPDENANSSKVCVQIMSRDGRYWAQNTFLVPAVKISGPVILDYASRYSQQLEETAAYDLAILSYQGACSSKKTSEFILTSRAKLSQQPEALIIYVNSARADTFASVVNRTSRMKPQKCRKITEGRRTGYDTICEIALQKEDTDLEQLRIKIYRRKYEKNLRPVDLLVRAPK